MTWFKGNMTSNRATMLSVWRQISAPFICVTSNRGIALSMWRQIVASRYLCGVKSLSFGSVLIYVVLAMLIGIQRNITGETVEDWTEVDNCDLYIWIKIWFSSFSTHQSSIQLQIISPYWREFVQTVSTIGILQLECTSFAWAKTFSSISDISELDIYDYWRTFDETIGWSVVDGVVFHVTCLL